MAQMARVSKEYKECDRKFSLFGAWRWISTRAVDDDAWQDGTLSDE